MGKLIISQKGQITLRRDLLNHLGVRPGDKVTVDKLPGGVIEIRPERGTGRISDLLGILKGKGHRRRPLTIQQMQKTTEKAWARKR